MVGDRGMISQKSVDALREQEGIDWITALKSGAIRALIDQGQLQPWLFDESNLFEFTHPDYPGERLVACRNPELAALRVHKREDLLQATEKNLEKVRTMVQSGRLRGQDKIGVRVGKVVNQYKVAKHITLDIQDQAFSFRRKTQSIAAEAALDGIYVIRTSLKATRMDGADCVRHYKSLARVERAFRTLKSVDLRIRPIHHRLETRVRAHISCACWPTTSSGTCAKLGVSCCLPIPIRRPRRRVIRSPRPSALLPPSARPLPVSWRMGRRRIASLR